MRQKLQIFHPIPNFQRIWNIQLEKDERWERPAVGAWYNDEEAVFVFPDKRVVTYADSNFGDDEYYKHHDFRKWHTFDNKDYEAFASGDNNLLIGSTKEGNIEIYPHLDPSDTPIVISADRGSVMALAARRYADSFCRSQL